MKGLKEEIFNSSREKDEACEKEVRIGLASLTEQDCNDGDDERIKCLLDGDTDLMAALHHGNIRLAETIIESGADVNMSNRNGETALMIAASEGYDSCVQQLVKAGADVNLSDNEGTTALMHAALAGKDGCLSALLESGADVNLGDNEGITALMHAALAGKDGCLGALLESGADVNRANEEGDTALSLVVLSESENFMKCFEVLIAAGADVNTYGKTYRKSPLVIAAKHIHLHYI